MIHSFDTATRTAVSRMATLAFLSIFLVACGADETTPTEGDGGSGGGEVVWVMLNLASGSSNLNIMDATANDNDDDDDDIHLSCLQTSPGYNYRGERMLPPPIDKIERGEVGQLLLLVDTTRTRRMTSNTTTATKTF